MIDARNPPTTPPRPDAVVHVWYVDDSDPHIAYCEGGQWYDAVWCYQVPEPILWRHIPDDE